MIQKILVENALCCRKQSNFVPVSHAAKKHEKAHLPISVSLGDTLERVPTHIYDSNPKKLIRRFMEELERRGKKKQR